MRTIVAQINNQLRRFGAEAIQKAQIPGRGTVIGYKPQYVIDAINAILGPENWRYEVVNFSIERGEKFSSVWVLVSLYIKTEEGWLHKGQHFGHAMITMGAVGDALKAATTDALGKAFSTMSIGRDAYAGLLARNGGNPLPVKEIPAPAPAPAPAQASAPSAPAPAPEPEAEAAPAPKDEEISPEELGIAPIPGVRFVVNPDFAAVVADEVEKGAVYKNRNLLKDAGFRWDREFKMWMMPLSIPPDEVEEPEPESAEPADPDPAGDEEVPF